MCDAEGEPLYDRTQEHLGTTDVFVIAVRRQLLAAAKQLQKNGEPPANVQKPELGRVRIGTFLLERGTDWKEATAPYLDPDSGENSAH